MSGTQFINRVEALVLVALGGFAGSNLRYFVATLSPGLGGTLIANATGSLALGVVLYEEFHTGRLASQTRTVLATGFMASYTTYSTFALQTGLAGPVWGAANVIGNYGLGFAGVLLGHALARRFEEN